MDTNSNVQDNKKHNSVYLGLGSNLGNRKENIELALNKIEKQIGKIISLSAFYTSEPFGFESDNMFVNCAVKIDTSLIPQELLVQTQAIEREMGRLHKTDKEGYADRIIDIDILLYNDLIIKDNPNLIIPHPHIQERDFVLRPLSEIADNVVHPVLNKTIMELFNAL